MWRAVLYVWCWSGVGWSYNTDHVTGSGGVTTQTMWRAVLYVWCWGGVELQHRPCDGVGWRYNTDHVACCPVCLVLEWGGVELQHRPCDGVGWSGVLSCMSGVGVGWSYNTDHVTGSGGVTTQTMWRAVLYVCGVWVGWGYNTDHVACCPVCLWGLGGVGLQHRPCDVLSCMSGVGGGVELQHRQCDVLFCLSAWVGYGGVR